MPDKASDKMEKSLLLAKAHVKAYTRKNGTAVSPHERHGNARADKFVSSMQKQYKSDKASIMSAIKEEHESLDYFTQHDPGFYDDDKKFEASANAYWDRLNHHHKELGGGDVLAKAHVDTYTKKDGTVVKAHDDKRVAAKQSDSDSYDGHPHVVGKIRKHKVIGDGGRGDKDGNGDPTHGATTSFDFNGKTYEPTGKTGTSMHDSEPVHEFAHGMEDGNRDTAKHTVWADSKGRVHADSKSEVAGLRAEYEKAQKPEPKKTVVVDKKSAKEAPLSPHGDENEDGWDKLPDAENPRYSLHALSSKLLGRVAKGDVNIKDHVHQELGDRGLDSDGEWAGKLALAKVHQEGQMTNDGDGFKKDPELGDHIQTLHKNILSAAAKGHLDLQKRAKATLADRGHDSSGKWIGFDAAKKHHGIK